jgi:uncharacterized protein (DUF1778 family)
MQAETLSERVWLRMSAENKESLQSAALSKGKTLSSEAHDVFSQHYGN